MASTDNWNKHTKTSVKDDTVQNEHKKNLGQDRTNRKSCSMDLLTRMYISTTMLYNHYTHTHTEAVRWQEVLLGVFHACLWPLMMHLGDGRQACRQPSDAVLPLPDFGKTLTHCSKSLSELTIVGRGYMGWERRSQARHFWTLEFQSLKERFFPWEQNRKQFWLISMGTQIFQWTSQSEFGQDNDDLTRNTGARCKTERGPDFYRGPAIFYSALKLHF